MRLFPVRLHGQRLLRWGLYALGGLVVVAAAAYATLPWWLPPELISGPLIQQLSKDFNRPVRLGAMKFSWTDGVILEDLDILEHEQWPSDYLARVKHIRCGFTPLLTAWRGQVDQVEVELPEIWLVFDENGNLLNLSDLQQRQQEKLLTNRFILRGATCHTSMPGSTQTFRFDRLECNIDPQDGVVSIEGETQVRRPVHDPAGPPGRLIVDARIIVPRLKHEASLHGTVELEWNDLSLGDLPGPLLQKLPIQQVEGASMGRAKIAVEPDLGLDYNFSIICDGVQVLRRGADRPAHVPDAQIRSAGHIDPKTDELIVRDFTYETPGLSVRRSSASDEPPLTLDLQGDTSMQVRLEGMVKDWAALRREIPELEQVARKLGIDLKGGTSFELALVHEFNQDRLTVTVDGRSARWRIGTEEDLLLDAGADVPKSLHLEMVYRHDQGIAVQPRLEARLGSTALTVSADAFWPQDPPAGLLEMANLIARSAQFEARLNIETLEELNRVWPALGRQVEASAGWKGPLRLALGWKNEGKGLRLSWEGALAAETVVGDGTMFHKPAGEPLTLEGTLLLATTEGTASLTGSVSHGSARLALDAERQRVHYAVGPVEANRNAGTDLAWDVDLRIPLRVEQVERFVELFPQLRASLQQQPEGVLRGGAEAEWQFVTSARPGDWLVQNELNLRADGLMMRWPELIEKPAGSPLRLKLVHRLQRLGEHYEHGLQVDYKAAPAAVSVALNTGTGERGPFDQLTTTAEVRDVAGLLTSVPGLAARVEPFELAGAGSLTASWLALEGTQKFSLEVDADRAGWLAPGEAPGRKTLGTPAHLRLTGAAQCAADDERLREWRVGSGEVRLSGLHASQLEGIVRTRSTTDTTGGDGPLSRLQQLMQATLESGSVTSAGTLTFDTDLADLHPAVRKLMEELSLSGRSTYRAEVTLTRDRLEATGSVDATGLGLSAVLDSPIVPALVKTKGTAAEYLFKAAIDGWTGATPAVQVEQSLLRIGENTFSMQGHLSGGPALGAELPEGSRIAAQMSLREPDRLLAMLPGNQIRQIEGQCEAAVSIAPGVAPLHAAVDFTDLRVGIDGVRLDGDLELNGSRLLTDRFSWRWGDSEGTLSGFVDRTPEATRGRLGIYLQRLNVDDLVKRIQSLSQHVAGGQPAQTGDRPTGQPTSPAQDENATTREVLEEIRRLRLTADVHIDTLEVVLPPGIPVTPQAVSTSLTAADGRLAMPFAAAVDGGYVQGQIEVQAAGAEPTLHLNYTADRLEPGPVVDTYLNRSFPGMKATGPLTLIDESHQYLISSPDQPNYPTGKGELIINGGTVVGRAAPLWLTRIFPGLNFASYDFSYMHSWFQKFQTGRVRHQMIYQGRFYNVYMIGHSDPDGKFDYEVGIDFLADFDSKFWAETGQGRVPLFHKTGRVMPDGKLVDEVVTFSPPQRILEMILVNNNPVFTAYHAVRRQVTRE